MTFCYVLIRPHDEKTSLKLPSFIEINYLNHAIDTYIVFQIQELWSFYILPIQSNTTFSIRYFVLSGIFFPSHFGLNFVNVSKEAAKSFFHKNLIKLPNGKWRFFKMLFKFSEIVQFWFSSHFHNLVTSYSSIFSFCFVNRHKKCELFLFKSIFTCPNRHLKVEKVKKEKKSFWWCCSAAWCLRMIVETVKTFWMINGNNFCL